MLEKNKLEIKKNKKSCQLAAFFIKVKTIRRLLIPLRIF